MNILKRIRCKTTSIFTFLLFPFISVFERIILLQKTKKLDLNPVFIVGAPRTGSTILYQVLTNNCDITYIDNLMCKWHRNIIFGYWLSRKRFSNRPHENFDSEYGDTNKYSQHAPSECGKFWYRWLSRRDHYADLNNISEQGLRGMQKNINLLMSFSGKPVIFKNLNAGQRLKIISDIFPNAKIIYIKREAKYVVLSVLNARKKNNIPEHVWWGIKPKNFRELLSLEEKKMVSSQITSIEKQINKDIKLFYCDNVKIINYNELSELNIKELSLWLGVEAKKKVLLPEFWKDN